MSIRVGETFQTQGRLGDYGVSVEEAISWIASGITLLPGDVISLGPSAAIVTVPANHPLASGAAVHAAIDGLGEIEIPITDKRDLQREPWPWPLVPRG